MILRFDRRLLRNVDWPLLGAAFVLVTLSVVCLSNLGAGRGGPALAWRQSTPQTTRGTLGWMLALVAVPFVLVVRQPDLGTALVLVPVLGAILVGMGLRLRILGALAAGAVAVMPLAWLALKPYQRDRLLVYLDPFRDPLGTAYNVIQAKIAIGSGQLLGKGISGATQSRLAFLPERHTDFIFAVFAEMW